MKEIEKILDKYFEGETTPQEENELKNYFRQRDIPEKFRIYKELFEFYDEENNLKIDNNIFDEQFINKISNQKQSNKALYYKIIGIAATLLIVFGSYLYFRPHTAIQEKKKIVLTSKEKFAINKTIEVFAKVSAIMSRVSKPLSKFQYIEKTDKELKKLNYYNEYNKLVLKYLGEKS